MKRVLNITLRADDATAEVQLLGQTVELISRGCEGDAQRAKALIEEFDGKVDAIALHGMPAVLQLGPAQVQHEDGVMLREAAKQTPIADGVGIRAGLERWGVILADRAQPGICSRKRALMVPGINHNGLIQALEKRSDNIQFADPFVYFGLPELPWVGSGTTLNRVAQAQLERLKAAPFQSIYASLHDDVTPRAPVAFEVADILAGDIGLILRYAPQDLRGKTVIVDHMSPEALNKLRERGVDIAVTLFPSLDPDDDLGRWPASVIEAVLIALREDPDAPMTEDTYLNQLAGIHWTPAVRYLQPKDQGINRFAFVIHPLSMKFIHAHPIFGKITPLLPERMVEEIAAYMPPFHIGRITGGVSPTTGQKIEGRLITLAATPRMMLKHDEHFTYRRLNKAARMAEKVGARIMGLGAFTSVVGDAGITVARESDIAITSGNSLTCAATLEAAKMAVKLMGKDDLTTGKVMIVGATGSIASVCSRLLAQAIHDVVLVSIEPEKLIELKRTIEEETPGAKVTIATRTGDLVSDCDLIVTATSAFGQRVIDLTKCKPGAVICDVARPMDINPAEGALRPDVLVIESGEVVIPGDDLNISYDIGLPKGTVYACLGETALLAMDGRFEDYTLGRDISLERVKEIWRLFKKHEFEIAGLRSFGDYVTEDFVAEKRKLADELRADPERFERVKAEAGEKLKSIPVMAKGLSNAQGSGQFWFNVNKAVGTALSWLTRRLRSRD